MRTFFFIFFVFTGLCFNINAQDDIIQVSIGANYANQTYYTLNTDETFQVGNDEWDIAFANSGPTEAGIHVNESVTLSFTGPSPKTLLYKAPTNVFSDVITIESIGDSLYNNETSWGYGGALNIQKDPVNWADFGWGTYNTDNHSIVGDRVFVIQLRDNSYRKFIIESLAGGVYTIRFAELDGTNEQTVAINKADYADQHLILFSFLDAAVLEEQAMTWDLSFQRYSDLDPRNVGVDVEYTVTGILTAPGVKSAQANDVNPDDVNFEDYLDSLDSQLDIIGQDWKYFSFETGWNIIDDVVYFVKTSDNILWQIYMYDFEGSSTGTYTFAKWNHGEVAGINDINSKFESVSLVPNPINPGASFSIILDSNYSGDAKINIYNMTGHQISSYSHKLSAGMNAIRLSTGHIPTGNYLVRVNTGEEIIVRKLSIK